MTKRTSVFQPRRIALVGTIAFMAAALLLTVFITYRGVGNASKALTRGQATALQADLRGEFRHFDSAPTSEDLEEILATYSESGLRYIAQVTRREVAAKAGASLYENLRPRALLRSLRRGEPSTRNGRVRLLLRAPGERRRRRRGGAAVPPKGGTPTIYIEFVPTEAQALRASSSRSLMVGAGAAAMLLLLAGFLMRWFASEDRLREQEETDRRLKSLGQMSAVLAHEIRNPLASLKGNAQILEKLIEKDGGAEGKSGSKAKRVVSEATRLESLINDLLNFAKSGELKRREVDPGALLQSCADLLSKGPAEVDAAKAPESWSLDSARMQQVLSNLLGNAAHMSERVRASVSVEEGELVYRVRDYGTGIDEANVARLFEPFHTKKVHGTGLGLAVAKRLVELHGGTIAAKNAEGGGAEFCVRIPPE